MVSCPDPKFVAVVETYSGSVVLRDPVTPPSCAELGESSKVEMRTLESGLMVLTSNTRNSCRRLDLFLPSSPVESFISDLDYS